jgi:ABC-type branched-subunit amino acid transport system substrate-binding protein
MKRITFYIITGLLLLAPFIGGAASAAPVTINQTSVKVGLLTPQSGGLSAYSSGFENAAQLAIDQLNDDADFSDYSFTLSVYDSQTDPTGSLNAMTQAVSDGVHYMVGAAGSSNTLSAASVAVANQIPMISYASTSPQLTTFEDDGYLFRTPPSDALQGKVLADLAKEGGYSDMVIVTLDNSYGEGLANSTRDEFIALGGNVINIYPYAETATDFTTIVTQVQSDEPDIVIAVSYATDGALLFAEIATQELDVQVIGADGVADVGIFSEGSGVAAAMAGYVVTKPSAVDSAEATQFAADYAAAYPSASGDIYTGETYDAVMAGAYAVKEAGSTTGSAIRDALGTISFNGATGTISFDENGDSSAGYYLISEVQGSTMVAVAAWDAINGLVFSDDDFKGRWVASSGGDDAPFPFAFFFATLALGALVIRKKKY